MRQLELECRVKARSHVLFIAKPKSARFFCPGPRDPQDLARNPGITHQAEPFAGREIVEVDLGMRSIAGDRDQEERDPSSAASTGFH